MRKVIIGFSGAMILVAVLTAWGVYRNHRLEKAFDAVKLGTVKEQVLKSMGKPYWIEPCGKSFGTPIPNCREYIYRDSFAPIAPQYWGIQFDTTGRVLNTATYSSP